MRGFIINSDKACDGCGTTERLAGNRFTCCEVCGRWICRKCKPHWCSAICSRCKAVEGGRIKELKALEAKKKRIMNAWAEESQETK